MKFSELQLNANVLEALDAMRFDECTPIQEQAIPIILEGKDPMLGIAGLGIAFHAKPKVVANAKQSINTIGLDGVLYFLGFKDSYLNM